MKLVRPGLCNNVYDCAARATEFSGKAILIYLEFLNRLFRKLVGWPNASAAQRLAEKAIVIVNAIYLKAVQSASLSAHRQVAAARVSDYSGCQRRKILKVAAVDRKVLD